MSIDTHVREPVVSISDYRKAALSALTSVSVSTRTYSTAAAGAAEPFSFAVAKVVNPRF